MQIFFTLFLMLTLIPVVELMLLIKLSQATSLPTTLCIVVLTGIIGAALARSQGLQTLWTLQNDLKQGKAPANAIADGVMILIAGALLVTPGILTDAVGFSLLVPQVRRVIQKLAVNYAGMKIRSKFVSRQQSDGQFTYTETTWTSAQQPQQKTTPSNQTSDVIDVEYTKKVD